MATIQRPVKTYGNRTYAAEVAAAPGNEDPILASEVDGDLDTIYAAWNGGADTVNIKDGAVTAAKLASTAQYWSLSGAMLTPTTATQTVMIPGDAAGGNAVMFGPTSVASRGRLTHHQTQQTTYVSENIALTGSGTWAQDDVSKPSWQLLINSAGDNIAFRRTPAGSTTFATLLTLDSIGKLTLTGDPAGTGIQGLLSTAYSTGIGENSWNFQRARANGAPCVASDYLLSLNAFPAYAANTYGRTGTLIFQATENHTASAGGTTFAIWLCPNGSRSQSTQFSFDQGGTGTFSGPSGNLIISGNLGQKATGTTWANPSDPRLKDDVAPYAAGLAEIVRLDPITYRLKSQPDGPLCYGFDAEKVRDVFPECVTTMRMKLDPADEEETDDVLCFDIHPILVALVNAVKELAAKVEAQA